MHKFKVPTDLPEPVLNPNARVVLTKRYLRKGPDGKPIEDFKGLFWRVAYSIAREEQKYEKSPYKVDELARIFYDLSLIHI